MRFEDVIANAEYHRQVAERERKLAEEAHIETQRLRDEAHRFAITHHRALRSRASVSSRLDGVAGVGPERRKAILKHFKTVEALRAASPEEIAQVPGLPESVARNVYAMLHEGEE